jgi:hypothetical protein
MDRALRGSMVFERRSRNYLASPDGAADPSANVSTVSSAVRSLWSMATPVYYRRHLILLIALLLIIISAPAVVVLRHGSLILNVIGVAVLLTGSYAISDRRQCFAIALILSILSIITTALLGLYPMHSTVIVAHGCGIFLLGFFSVRILDYVVRSGGVTADKIFAAICAYLLIGYA